MTNRSIMLFTLIAKQPTSFDKSRYQAASATIAKNETVSMGRLALIDIQGTFAI
ncbi:hypothetical protein [Paenibacillus sp. PL91]|uniref:hypothetical protein n=1 Tax=Paenibacillus sp. PL91 TaxID=2729538 RepID=UPI00145DF251|nr:hypothetical protein [Paenibacillus sp. PL91]MBC9204206.1 hypothetical protein [Paenibacillus sp. PL91]